MEKGLLKANLSWTRSERVSDGQDLYHMMPINMRLAIDQNKSAWNNALKHELMNNKTLVDDIGLEPGTAGYGLVNLRISY